MIFNSSANRCFVCGPGNQQGLKVRFSLNPEHNECEAQWTSSANYVGYDNVTHGGILFCLLDDVMANFFFLRGEICMTAKAEIRFHESLGVGESVQVKSQLVKRRRNLVILKATATRTSDNTLIASSTGHFMITGKLPEQNQ